MTTFMVMASRDDGILTVRLDRGEKLNALTPEMIDALHRYFVDAADDGDVRCLLLEANGRAFCVGRDISEAQADEDATRILTDSINPMLQALYDCPKPSIAAVNGAALGIGLGLALGCDITLAGFGASFSSPFANLGGALDSGGHYFLPKRIGDARALELIYTGKAVDGRTAEQWGLVNRAVPDAVLASTSRAMARRIADGPTIAYLGQKDLVRKSRDLDFSSVLHAEAQLQGALSRTADYAEGLAAFHARRPANFKASSRSARA